MQPTNDVYFSQGNTSCTRTMHTKLTLRLDSELIAQAKRHTQAQGKTLSRLVADYFTLLDHGPGQGVPSPGPLVQSLRGVLRDSGLDIEDYNDRSAQKHR